MELRASLGLGAPGSCDEEANPHLEEVPAEFVGGPLEVFFAVVGAGRGGGEGGGQEGRRTQKGRKEPGEDAERRKAAGDGECEDAGEGRMGAKVRPRKSADGPVGMATAVAACRAGSEFDGAVEGVTLAGVDRGEQRRQRVGKGAVLDVAKLGVSPYGEEVRSEKKLGRAKVVPLRRVDRTFWEALDLAIWVGSGELRGQNGGEAGGNAAEKGDVAVAGGDKEFKRLAAGVCLVDGGERLLCVLGATSVVGRGGEGEEHRTSVADSCLQ